MLHALSLTPLSKIQLWGKGQVFYVKINYYDKWKTKLYA